MARLSPVAIARHNQHMELTPRLRLMSWLVSQGLTGLPENDLIRGFCERCCAEGLQVSRGMVFIDTLHPIFEGRGFRWNDAETNESDVFEYGSTNEGEAAEAVRRPPSGVSSSTSGGAGTGGPDPPGGEGECSAPLPWPSAGMTGSWGWSVG